MCYENKPLTLISGDLFSLDVELEGTERSLVRAVWFSSKSLGIRKVLTYIKEEQRSRKIWYRLYLSSEETKNFPSGTALYDLTVEFADENYMTAQYNASMIIQEKINGVVSSE